MVYLILLFSYQHAQPFLAAYSSRYAGHSLPKDTLRATFMVIPKERKDATKCSNYQTVFLFNTDLKPFTKMLTNRLLPGLWSTYTPKLALYQIGRPKTVQPVPSTPYIMPIIEKLPPNLSLPLSKRCSIK